MQISSKLIWVIGMTAVWTIAVNAQTITTETFGSGANQFSIDFVTIGNPGNEADTTGDPNPAGSVSYVFNLGKYEISRDQIEKANSAGSLGITLEDMTSYGANGPKRPATGVSWYEAALFVNYLNTSQNYSPAYNFGGPKNPNNPLGLQLWNSSEPGFQANLPLRNSQARYFLPSGDEWYKAAYGSPDGSWFKYPTGSQSAPSPVLGGTDAGTAIFASYDESWNPIVYPSGPADIDSAGGLSAFGTMGQGGNVFEWTDGPLNSYESFWLGNMEVRGGLWDSPAFIMENGIRPSNAMWDESYATGFRVGMVPEPSSCALLVLGIGGVIALRRVGRRAD